MAKLGEETLLPNHFDPQSKAARHKGNSNLQVKEFSCALA
jgi:hypothetical protein